MLVLLRSWPMLPRHSPKLPSAASAAWPQLPDERLTARQGGALWRPAAHTEPLNKGKQRT
jgi:hypothetical protein